MRAPSVTRHYARDHSPASPTRFGRSTPNKVVCCFAKRGKPLKSPTARTTRNSRKRFSDKRVAPVVATRSIHHPTYVEMCYGSQPNTIAPSAKSFSKSYEFKNSKPQPQQPKSQIRIG